MKPSKIKINPSNKKYVEAIKSKAKVANSVPALREIVAELCEAVKEIQR